jgi:hypothetical protein
MNPSNATNAEATMPSKSVPKPQARRKSKYMANKNDNINNLKKTLITAHLRGPLNQTHPIPTYIIAYNRRTHRIHRSNNVSHS